MTALVAIGTEPTSLVAVHDQCAKVEKWADRCESVAELRDATNKLAAIDEYLSRTSTEGRARVAAAMRRLEVRVGKLLGPAEHGGDRKSDQVNREELDLSAQERHAFRQMADNEDIVEQAIAESSDEHPPSRRKVIETITGKVDRSPAASAARIKEIRELARKGHTSKQIGSRVNIADAQVRVIAKRNGIDIPADVAVLNTTSNRKPDANRIVSTIVHELEGSRISIGLVDYSDLEREHIGGWVSSLSESIKTLQSLKARLAKELTRE